MTARVEELKRSLSTEREITDRLHLQIDGLKRASHLKDDEIVYLNHQLGVLRRAKYGDCAHPWNDPWSGGPRTGM